MLVRYACLTLFIVIGATHAQNGPMNIIPGATLSTGGGAVPGVSADPGSPNPATPVPGPHGAPVVPTASNGVVLNSSGMPAGGNGPTGTGLPAGFSPAANIAPGALVLIQPNSQVYGVEERQLIVTWQPMDPTITLQSLPPNLVIECYPEIPIPVGGPFGFVSLVRTDAGQFKYTLPKGWAGEHWVVELREQGGVQIIAGQRFAIKPVGTPLAPSTNIAGNTIFSPGSPGGWPMNAAGRTEGFTAVMVATAATVLAMLLA